MMKVSRLYFLAFAGTKWISTLRYGFEGAPVFGAYSSSGSDSSSDTAQRQLYAKALVYASCGGRLARDWIAGCASLSLSDAELVTLALQHDSTRDDLIRLHQAILKRRQLYDGALEGANPNSTNDIIAAQKSSAKEEVVSPVPEFFPVGYRKPPLSALSPASSTAIEEEDEKLTPLSPQEAETVIRCFVYDAVKAASFHSPSLLPEQIRHLEDVCDVLGVSALDQSASAPSESTNGQAAVVTRIPFLQDAIDIAVDENGTMRDKSRVIEQHTVV